LFANARNLNAHSLPQSHHYYIHPNETKPPLLVQSANYITPEPTEKSAICVTVEHSRRALHTAFMHIQRRQPQKSKLS